MRPLRSASVRSFSRRRDWLRWLGRASLSNFRLGRHLLCSLHRLGCLTSASSGHEATKEFHQGHGFHLNAIVRACGQLAGSIVQNRPCQLRISMRGQQLLMSSVCRGAKTVVRASTASRLPPQGLSDGKNSRGGKMPCLARIPSARPRAADRGSGRSRLFDAAMLTGDVEFKRRFDD